MLYIILMILSLGNVSWALDSGILETKLDNFEGLLMGPKLEASDQRQKCSMLIEECVGVPGDTGLPITVPEMLDEMTQFFEVPHIPSEYADNVNMFIENAKEICRSYQREIDANPESLAGPSSKKIREKLARKTYCLYEMIERVRNNFLEDNE